MYLTRRGWDNLSGDGLSEPVIYYTHPVSYCHPSFGSHVAAIRRIVSFDVHLAGLLISQIYTIQIHLGTTFHRYREWCMLWTSCCLEIGVRVISKSRRFLSTVFSAKDLQVFRYCAQFDYSLWFRCPFPSDTYQNTTTLVNWPLVLNEIRQQHNALNINYSGKIGCLPIELLHDAS